MAYSKASPMSEQRKMAEAFSVGFHFFLRRMAGISSPTKSACSALSILIARSLLVSKFGGMWMNPWMNGGMSLDEWLSSESSSSVISPWPDQRKKKTNVAGHEKRILLPGLQIYKQKHTDH